MDGQKPYFPMFLDISEKRIVVIGGGNIAKRRVETLLMFAEDITVVSPTVNKELKGFMDKGLVRWICAAWDTKKRQGAGQKAEEDRQNETWQVVENADIVLAATDDPQCNEQLAAFCKERGILVNASHKKELCDFYFPAVAVRDQTVVGITSGGTDYGRTRRLREQTEKLLETENLRDNR